MTLLTKAGSRKKKHIANFFWILIIFDYGNQPILAQCSFFMTLKTLENQKFSTGIERVYSLKLVI